MMRDILNTVLEFLDDYVDLTRSAEDKLETKVESQAGKLYELYCLAHVVWELEDRLGVVFDFPFDSIDFQASPTAVNVWRPHFQINVGGQTRWRLMTDVEFITLSKCVNRYVSDRSQVHELDIVLIPGSIMHGYPSATDLYLGVECKSQKKFRKSILKEVLEIRREMSLLKDAQSSLLQKISRSGVKYEVQVNADPASEYWVFYLDPMGDLYSEGPAQFGVSFRNLLP